MFIFGFPIALGISVVENGPSPHYLLHLVCCSWSREHCSPALAWRLLLGALLFLAYEPHSSTQAKGRVKRAETGEIVRARGSRKASWEVAGFEFYSQYDWLIGGGGLSKGMTEYDFYHKDLLWLHVENRLQRNRVEARMPP